MYSLSMFFYKDGVKYKEAEVKNLNYAKDVDNSIKYMLEHEYHNNITKNCTKYIYDTTNHQTKKEYLDNGSIREVPNDNFYYNADTKKFYAKSKFEVDTFKNYAVITVVKGKVDP